MFRVRGGRTAVPGAGAGCRGRGERPGGRPVPVRCAGPSVDATVSGGPDVPGAALGLPDIGVTTRRTAARPSSDSRSRAAAPAIRERHHRTAAPPRAARPGSARCAAASPLRGRRRRPSRWSAVGPAGAPQWRTPEQPIRRRSTELSPQPSCPATRRTGLPAVPNSRVRGRIPAPVRCRRPSPYCPAGSGRPAGQLRRRRPGSRGRPKNSRPRRAAVTPDASGCPSYPNRPSRPSARPTRGTAHVRPGEPAARAGRTAMHRAHGDEHVITYGGGGVVAVAVGGAGGGAGTAAAAESGGWAEAVQGGASRCWVAAHESAVGGQGAPHGCGPRGCRRRTASARSPPERGGLAGLRSIPICRTCA